MATEGMTVERASQMMTELARELTQRARQFEAATGLSITDIQLERIQQIGRPSALAQIGVTVSLEVIL